MKTKNKRTTSLPPQNLNAKIQKKSRYSKSESVKSLEIMADEAARKKYPNTPTEWLAPRKYSDKTANGLTKCIIDFLRFKNCQAERISTTGRLINNQKSFVDVVGRTRFVGEGAKWIPGTGTNGSADISATIRGRSVKIEVKINRDRQSEYQKKYQQDIERAGGVYIIATSFEKFYKWVNDNYGRVNYGK